jgi:hypothetical protein
MANTKIHGRARENRQPIRRRAIGGQECDLREDIAGKLN